MLKEEGGGGVGGWARACDTCSAAACTVYCRADAAYLCASCDARVHAANRVASRHERVWVCEACERAPAALLCKADAASLCAACDAEVHSANPLARRHQRVPILPLSGYPHAPHEAHHAPPGNEEADEDEAASWLLPNPERNNGTAVQGGGGTTNGLLFGDEYLELVEYNGDQEYTDNQNGDVHFNDNNENYSGGCVPAPKSYGGDSVVPVDHCEAKFHGFQVGYENSEAAYSCYSNGTISHSVSVSSLDMGVVPDSTMSDISMSHPRPPKGTIDLFSGAPMNMPSQLSPMDREARVLRYREKKKTRKFEKTIRYASRKAYAETRPRIKGRFAKRTDVDIEVDQMFSTGMMVDSGYGIVPSL